MVIKSEHTPAPSPGRAIYGFVLYILTYVVFGLYFIWAFFPDDWLAACGITYIPQRYWVLATPVYLCTCIVFAVTLYFAHSLVITPSFDSVHIITDEFNTEILLTSQQMDLPEDAIPPIADLHPEFVSKTLYVD